jgi:hypothetical protein
VIGAIVGAASFFTLSSVNIDLWYVFVAAGLLTAAAEIVRVRRASLPGASTVRTGAASLAVRGFSVFAAVSACAFGAFALLYVGLVAP